MATADKLPDTLKRLRLFGLLARIEEIRNKPWLEEVLAIELEEKTRRSLAHRQHLAGIGAFKSVSAYDWKWPRKIDRTLVEELFTLAFIAEGTNVVFLGPNGVGKTMLLRNLADCALNAGNHVVVRTASDLLADLIKQESSVARARRLMAYVVATGAGGHQNHRNHRRPHARRWCGARISTSAKCAWARKRDVGGVAADVRARVSPVRG